MQEQCQVCYETFLSECVTNGVCRACRIDIELDAELDDAIRVLEDVGQDIYSRRKPAEARRVPPQNQEPLNGAAYKLGRSCVYCLQPIADLAPEVPYDELDAHWRCTREAIRGDR